ncbi:MAG: type VI secretion system tube protein TssD [Ferruginibacter sp.]
MSFQAKLILGDDGLEFNVLNAEYALSRPIDAHNRPNGRLRGGIIEVTIETGTSYELIRWISTNLTMNGKVEFYRRDAASSTQKTVEFRNAFCVSLKEFFISDGSSPMITKIVISAHEMDINNETVRNTWAGMESSDSGSSGSAGSTTPAENTSNSVTFGDE